MKVWCFSGAAGLGALTHHEDAAILPTDLGPWRAVASLVLRDDHEDDREAKRLIIEHGYCCFDEKPDDRSEGAS